jgi:hypothetical protein
VCVAESLTSAYEKAHRVEAATTIGEDIQSAAQLRMAVGGALALLKAQGHADAAAKAAVREAMRARLRCTAKALHRKYLRLQGAVRAPQAQETRHRRPLAQSQRDGPATVLESIRRTARAAPLTPAPPQPLQTTSATLGPPEAAARKVAAEKLLVLKARRRREYILQACMLLETQSFLRAEAQDVRECATAARRLGQYFQSLTLQLDPVCQSLNAANRDLGQPSNFRLFVDALRLAYGDLPVLRALAEEFELDLKAQPRPPLRLENTAKKVRRSSSFSEASPRKRSREEFDAAAAAATPAPTVPAAWKSNSTGTFITRSNSAPNGTSLAKRMQRSARAGLVLHTVTVTSRRPGAVARGAAANPRKLRRT